MAFEILRNDIVNMRVDAIVNTANPRPVVGGGTDAAIHGKAGPELLEARKRIGRIRPGESAVTPAFGLDARYVIHTVGPVWRGGLLGEEKVLRRCYDSALAQALALGCRSVAFPLISSGAYGFPKDKALSIAIQAFSDFLLDHEMRICLVVFHSEAFRLSEKLFRDVASYIDDHYVDEKTDLVRRRWAEADMERGWTMAPMPPCSASVPAPQAKACAMSLEEMLKNTDAGFSERLLQLIDQTGEKDSAIYTKANVSRQHFSKIRNNPDYKPTKSTALAFAVALELDLEQTRDLIGRAGYALTNSSRFDVILMYFIERKNYNLHDINAALYEFDQSLLGA